MCPLLAFLDSPATLMVLGVLAVLLFGERLPEVARTVGKYFMDFKRGVRGIQDEIQSAIHAADSVEPNRSSPRFAPPEDREEATAPKFEPPSLSP